MDRIKKLVKHYFPETKLITFYRHGPNLLSKFSSRIKSKNNFTETGIYKIPCKNCDKYYIGETGRSLGLRIKEHTNMRDVNKSAVANHRFLIGHDMDFQSTKIIHRENSIFKRKIAESLLISDGSVIQENSSSYTPILFK